ncbi:MAG: DOMON domain-containing protein, partial [Flavobacteriales bacterium]
MKNKFLLLSLFLLLATAFNAQSYTTGVVNITTTSGLAMSVKIDISTNVTLTLTGPSGRWFALGFNANSMTNGTDVVGVHSATTLNAFDAKLTGFGAPVTDSQQDWTITSDVVNAGVRTIIATRALNTFDPNDYTFSATPTTLGLIWARSASASFTYSNHGSTNRGTALVSFTYVPPPAPPAAPTGSANQTFCSGATLAQLSATGTAVQWYATPTGGSALPSNTV